MSSSRGSSAEPGESKMAGLWSRIQRGAKAVGDFQARLILNLLYAILILPTGLISKVDGDLLDADPPTGDSFWQERFTGEESLSRARRQG